MSNSYSEDQLVVQPAIGLFEDLGWETVSAAEEVFGANPHPGPLTSSISASLRFSKGEGVTLGRLAKSEVGPVELAEKKLFHSISNFHQPVKQ